MAFKLSPSINSCQIRFTLTHPQNSGTLLLMDTLGHRLKDARLALGLSQKKLADKAGVSQGLIHKLETGFYEGTGQIVPIAGALDVRPEWLHSGEQPRRWGNPQYKDLRENSSHSSADGSAPSGHTTSEGYALIPIYSVHASAGLGEEVIQEDVLDHLAFQTSWLSQKGLDPCKLGVIQTQGDSMYPTFDDGDVLLLDMGQREVVDGKVFVLRSEEYLYVKRLQILPGRILIVSDNPKYQSVQVTREERELWKIVGRVVWVGREI
ncbi:putative phage repressor [Magnetococcus marinus MC-1]|uniref:Putative phage repressor n=2 Tax=Magnetococcus TaxID=162171 RepID=A0LBC5_MAGMM|nr:putative phage repressor [Magnetococcus marinus MC-1]